MPADVTSPVGDHTVTLYEREEDLIELVGDELVAEARAGATIIVIARPTHRARLEARLAEAGVDPERARKDGRYAACDAAETLASIRTRAGVEDGRFAEVVGSLVEVGRRRGRVWIFGEMVDLLWQAGDVTGALDLEERWNDLLHRAPAALTCGYQVDRGTPPEILDAICHAHSQVITPGDCRARKELPAVAEAAGTARRFVVDTLERLGCAGLGDEAALVVSELATNALLHARSPFTVVVERSGGAVRISVEDASATATSRRAEQRLAASGRGLDLVAAIADRWGEERTPGGKIVWAELGGDG